MIAILMATYNGEDYIREQLNSILSQSYKDFVLYVHDDGSTDRTAEILNEYKDRYPNRINVLDGSSTGSAKDNFLYMMGMVDSDYYMFSDQDDVWLPDKIKVSVERMTELENRFDYKPLLVFSDLKVVNAKKKVLDNSFMHYSNLDPYDLQFNKLIVQNVAPGCSMLFNRYARDMAMRYSSLPTTDNICMHDWWLMLVVSALGMVSFIDEPLVLYRQHGNNTEGARKEYGMKKILQLVWWTISLTHIGITKRRILKFVKQGQELRVLKLTGDNKKIVKGLLLFYDMSKIERIRFMRRFKIYRNKRNLWQMMCL